MRMKKGKDISYIRGLDAKIPNCLIPNDKIQKGDFLYWRRGYDVLSIWTPDLDGKCVYQGPYFADEDTVI